METFLIIIGALTAIFSVAAWLQQPRTALSKQVKDFAAEFDSVEAVGISIAYLPGRNIERAHLCIAGNRAFLRHRRGIRLKEPKYTETELPVAVAESLFEDLTGFGLFSLQSVQPRIKDGTPAQVFAMNGEQENFFAVNPPSGNHKRVVKSILEFASTHSAEQFDAD